MVVYMDTDWWQIYGGDIYGSGDDGSVVVVYGSDDEDGVVAAWQLVSRTRNSKRLDSKTSNLTRRCNRKFNKANTEQKIAKAQIGSDMMI